MKKVLLIALLSPLFAQADQLAFEPYVDAQYGCNYTEGQNSVIKLEASAVDQAVNEASAYVNQSLTIGCNRDLYTCVHHNDVEPKVTYRETQNRSLKVVGGRIVDLSTGREVAELQGAGYHQNLRPAPRCKY